MRTMRRCAVVVLAITALVAGCTSSQEPSASPTPAPGVTVTATTTATASPSAAPTATATVTASASPSAPTTASPGPSACEPFGTQGASASSSDWSSDLRTAPGDQLWGVTMRVGTHPCYDRWVFEFAGDGTMPGWAVTPRPAATFPVDGSGADLAPPLAGTASLEVTFGAWYDGTAIEQPGYAGPRVVVTRGFESLLEARIIGGFEGITQVGIGLDELRPYRVTWLEDPGRLVVDVFTG